MAGRDTAPLRKRPRLLTLGTGSKRSSTVPVSAILLQQTASSLTAPRRSLCELAFKAAQQKLLTVSPGERIPDLPQIMLQRLLHSVRLQISAPALSNLCHAGHAGWLLTADPIWCRLCAEIIKSQALSAPPRRPDEPYWRYYSRLTVWQEESLRELGERIRESYETDGETVRPLKVIGARRIVSVVGPSVLGRPTRDPFPMAKSSSSLMKKAKSEIFSVSSAGSMGRASKGPPSGSNRTVKMFPPVFKK